MLEEIIIGGVFLGAVFFMGRTLYKQYKSDRGCAVGCASCSVPEPVKKKEIKLPEHLKS